VLERLDAGLAGDTALAAEALNLPAEAVLAEAVVSLDQPIDPEAIHAARVSLRRHLAARLRDAFEAAWTALAPTVPYAPDGAQVGQRALRNACLGYLAESGADRVAVFSEGRIEQLDTPRGLYTRPRTAFVASFVGSANVVSGALAEHLTGRRTPFAIRPELIEIQPAEGALPEGLLAAAGTLEDVLYHGASSRCHVRIDADTLLAVARAESAGAAPLPPAGSRVRLAWRPADAVMLES